MIVINGRFLIKPMQGIPRYVYEVICALDKIVSNDDDVVLLVPDILENTLHLQNIKIIYKKYSNVFCWDFSVVEGFARKHHALYLNMACGGLYLNSIVAVHDVRSLMMHGVKTETWKNLIKSRLMFELAFHFSKCIVTVSEVSKKEIHNFLDRSKRVEVSYNGWEHTNRIIPNKTIFEKFASIKKGGFYLTIGSVAPHKNYKWIIDNAAINPHCQYVVVGGFNPNLWPDKRRELESLKNIVYLGYQSDEVLKALLLNAKALIFPTLYEGFGIPPLEALACGTKVVVSDIPVMREIYGDSVEYLDPYNANLNLDEIDWNKDRSAAIQLVLQKYTWAHTAQKWYELMKEYS